MPDGALAIISKRHPPEVEDEVFQRLAEKFRASRLIFAYKRLAVVPDFLFWRLRGSPRPKVPHLVKERALKGLGSQFGLKVLVETGTQYGQMVTAARHYFREIYSIELDRRRYEAARRQFAADPHIHLLHGDSSAVLPKLLESFSEPCLFWLDAHSSVSPLTAELSAIFRHRVQGHVILIDDAQRFDGRVWSPTLGDIRQLVAELNPGASVEVRENNDPDLPGRKAPELTCRRVLRRRPSSTAACLMLR